VTPRDLRAYARTTTARLIAGGLLLVLVVGGALVFAIYGPGALASSLLCIATGLSPVALVVLALAGIDFLRRRIDRG
jgi:hypothetical protein